MQARVVPSMGVVEAGEEEKVNRGNRVDRVRRAVGEEYGFVWRILRRFGVPDRDVDDAAQHVFLAFAQSVDRIDPIKERPFLFATAFRVASNLRRQVRPDLISLRSPDEEPSPVPATDELVDQRRARAVLDSLLDTLPPKLRAVFVLYELEGLTASDVALILEIPNGTVASRLRRARAKFFREVERMKQKRKGTKR